MARRFAQPVVAAVTIFLLGLAAGTVTAEEATMDPNDATPSPWAVQAGRSSEKVTSSAEGEAIDRVWSSPCDIPTAVEAATIVLGVAAVAVPCVVVSAGDLVTWLNPTTALLAIQ